ncbi:hypothetical protein GCM10011344_11390 [Dokdonia pacifica]|uniref:Uncharacterized protein n=1 Tax=Dokdonia pacifica TaxID=1627892 RepID=A0A238YIR8_9FLAO|nr:hypothetical protein [Dokdonia pacifica]GGG12450.1 hypothetical protein GCM10011344_11390 [Dokdonia pacifica]SNR70289.1 hypothetical protein SAMN06265376_10254 [Dokdonia pacifica]
MKHVIQITTALFLLVQTMGYSQVNTAETLSKNENASLKNDQIKEEVDHAQLQKFVGNYLLEEADFELEIVKEDDKMYIISPFSKDLLTQKNETTLREPTRGVDLELIADNNNALKFTQNGYETIIKKVRSKTD